jgi:CspA family cold shock protein
MNGIEGKVVWFNNAKGFGFLSRETGPDVFCHYSSIQTDGYKTLKEGDPVRYDIVQGDKGPQADNVRLAANAQEASTAVAA